MMAIDIEHFCLFISVIFCLFKLKATESDALTSVTQIDTELAAWN